MDKKDIYEHLARIYLEASSKKGKEPAKRPSKFLKNSFIIISVLTFGTLIFLLADLYKSRKVLNSGISLVLVEEAVKVNFHFDPAKKESYSVNLNNLDLSEYTGLIFSVKNSSSKDTQVTMKVEFANSFNERAEVYVKNLAGGWQDYKIDFSEFKNMSDWSKMKELSFVVEEWNVTSKKGVVYLDNIMLVKEKKGG
ncbi:MAG: hypothetical protein DRP74_04595 [Candidatus Omnitrophota bacterium]|nr:MAG: hypothetical protein DRP74_04595 [Candidatus Omnitrophota bacterium]